jgi:hypothetical protein
LSPTQSTATATGAHVPGNVMSESGESAGADDSNCCE